MLKLPGVVSRSLGSEEPGSTRSSHQCHSSVDYKLVRHLGRGSGGSVKLVWREDHHIWSLMAMKVVNKWKLVEYSQLRACTERDFLVSFCHNADVAAANYIIRFRAAHQTITHLYFFFDYCKGGDLLAYLQRYGPLTPSSIMACVSQLIIAVNYVHSCGFIHGDIRLENILITATGDLRLADFGSCYKSTFNYHSDWSGLAKVIYELSTCTRYSSTYLPYLQTSDRESVSSMHCSLLSWSDALYPPIITTSPALLDLEFSTLPHSKTDDGSCSEDDESDDPLLLRCFSYESI